MQHLIPQHPTSRPLRRSTPRLVALAMCLTLGACDSADNPLDPGDDSPVAAAEPGGANLITASQRIAFISYRDPGAPNLANGNIYKVDPWGKNEVRVTGDFENDYAPSWSWDNKRIASVRYRVADGLGRNDIWIVNADGTGGHWARFAQSPFTLFDPKWHPDGNRLVVSAWISPYWWLATLDLTTGVVSLLGQGGTIGTRPAYNKAGTKIAFVGQNYNTIEQINADGTGRKVLVTSTLPVDRPAFSPDGKKIAYERGSQPSGGDIYVRNLTTGGTKRLTFHSAPDREATWSPDGTRIAFMSRRSGKAQIYTMSAASGGDVKRITSNEGGNMYPSWSH